MDKGLWSPLTVLISVVASVIVSYYTSQLTRAVAEDQRDADLLSRFADFHVSDDARRRRFSVYIVERIKGPGWRRGLRQFIISETLSRHFKDAMPVVPFDRDHDDWDLVGDAAYNLQRDWGKAKDEPAKTFADWWCKKKSEYTNRWPRHKQAIDDLYRYLDEFHFKEHGTPVRPCETVKN